MKERTTAYTALILPDMHFPWACEFALGVVLNAVRRIRPEVTLFLGDCLDMAELSRFRAEGAAADYYKHELLPFLRFYQEVAEHSEEIAFIEGNHEDRLRKAANENRQVAALRSLADPEAHMRRVAPDTPLNYVRYHRAPMHSHVQLAKDLIAVHGWSFAKAAAHKHMDMAKGRSIVFGHCHRAMHVAEKDPITDRGIESWCPGTLSKLQPAYRHSQPTQWSQGFSILRVTRPGVAKGWAVQHVKIDHGYAVLPDGTEVAV